MMHIAFGVAAVFCALVGTANALNIQTTNSLDLIAACALWACVGLNIGGLLHYRGK